MALVTLSVFAFSCLVAQFLDMALRLWKMEKVSHYRFETLESSNFERLHNWLLILKL